MRREMPQFRGKLFRALLGNKASAVVDGQFRN
jgi:hypothetical protein